MIFEDWKMPTYYAICLGVETDNDIDKYLYTGVLTNCNFNIIATHTCSTKELLLTTLKKHIRSDKNVTLVDFVNTSMPIHLFEKFKEANPEIF